MSGIVLISISKKKVTIHLKRQLYFESGPQCDKDWNMSSIRREIYSLQSLNLLWWGQWGYAQGRWLFLLLYLRTAQKQSGIYSRPTVAKFIHHYTEYLPRSTCSGPRWWWPAVFQTKEPHQGQTLELWSWAQTGFYIRPNPYSDTQAETQISIFMVQYSYLCINITMWYSLIVIPLDVN